MTGYRIFLLVLYMVAGFSLKATNYYINALEGNDSNKGTGPMFAWKTITPITTIQFKPGDSVLFATGQRFSGMVSIIHVKGQLGKPVVFSGYPYKGNQKRPIIDAGNERNALLIENSSFIEVKSLVFTATTPFQSTNPVKNNEMRCGILVLVTDEAPYEQIKITDVSVHDVYYQAPGFKISAAETATANGTQAYGWGVRFINKSEKGLLQHIKVSDLEVFNVSHTGVKFTSPPNGIRDVVISGCKISQTGGPGIQLSGVTDGHIHHNSVEHSGSISDGRNWGRGSGLWTWGCSNILIEQNRFEHANGPGDSAGVHIDFNCKDVVVQYNVSANNAGGFCEILGNNFNCAYRYNISINDGYRVKGKNGAFQEGKIFWLSGYQGDKKSKAGPYNSYFYNNTIYVADSIVPRIAISQSSSGVLIANNIFYFENAAMSVPGDQKKNEKDSAAITNVIFTNNLYLHLNSWPDDLLIRDLSPAYGDPVFKNKGGISIGDYQPLHPELIVNKGIIIPRLPNDSIGLRIGLVAEQDIKGNKINGLPDLGAIEIKQ